MALSEQAKIGTGMDCDGPHLQNCLCIYCGSTHAVIYLLNNWSKELAMESLCNQCKSPNVKEDSVRVCIR